MLSPAAFSYPVTSEFVEKKENVLGTILFRPLPFLTAVCSFSNKQRGNWGEQY